MRFALLVAWREYAENAKTKGFWLGILLVPVIIFFSVQVPLWLETKGTPTRYFVLVDQSGLVGPVITARVERDYQREVWRALKEYARKYGGSNTGAAPSLDQFIRQGGQDAWLAELTPGLRPDAPPFKAPRRAFELVALPSGVNPETELPALAQELKPYLRGERHTELHGQDIALNAAILVPRDLAKQIVRSPGATTPTGIEYWSDNLADSRLREAVEETVNTEIRRREYLARGLDAAAVRAVEQTHVPVSSLNPRKESGREAVGAADIIKQWAPSAFVYLLWVAIFAIAQMLLSNIIEEKSNRIIEVLLSSVTPGELMLGKLLGIAAVGLTMVGAWILTLFAVLGWKAAGAVGTAAVTGPILDVLQSSRLLPMFGIYFVLGYLLYAACILALGSVCNTLKEAQSYMAVITMVMMVPLLTLTFIPKDPNGLLARVLSWIPLYTPFIMMNRAMADPPWIDLIGTLLLLVAAVAGALWMAGKVFRIGILRTGQPPKLLEMLRWLRR